MGDARKDALRVEFDSRIKLELVDTQPLMPTLLARSPAATWLERWFVLHEVEGTARARLGGSGYLPIRRRHGQ